MSNFPSDGHRDPINALSAAICVVRDVLPKCESGLVAVQRRLHGEKLPERIGVEDSDLPRPATQAQEVATRLKSCAETLQNASAETGE